jgi:hypothetical protein
MIRRPLRALALALGLAALAPAPASACGGCFAPPQAVQVVTDHRMVLSVSAQRTTLWDQFGYTGRPEDFSWILPIRYTERTNVSLASNEFMVAADRLTEPYLQPPPPPRPPFCGDGLSPSAGGSADAGASADAGVTVLREEVVGPYAVSIIRGTDAMAVRTWLRDNGYAVPTAIEPVIDHYTALNMDYIALRLRPGEGIDRMSPVRVTFEGNMPRLPLRMIAAGVADKVGISLVVLANSRMEAMNFPNGELSDNDFTWDWNQQNSPARDFLNAFERLNNANGGRVWLTESSTAQQRARWLSAVSQIPGPSRDAGVPEGDAGVMMPSDPMVDVGVAFEGLGNTATVTRLRADLLGRMLDRDLELAASTRGERGQFYRYGNELNRPTFPPCPVDAGVSRTDAGTPSVDAGTVQPPAPQESSGGLACAARPGTHGAGAMGAMGLLAVSLGAAFTARRRRRGP